MNNTDPLNSVIRRFNYVGGWCGFLYVILALIGWCIMGGYWPLHTPTDTAAEIQQFYQNSNLPVLRLGLIVLMWAAVPELIFTAAVASHLSKIEGRTGPLTLSMVIGGFASAILTFYPAMWWLTAAFRPENREQDVMLLLNDAGWLQLVGGVSLAAPMYIGHAIAVLADKSANPVFPRWTAYFSLWVLIGLFPGQLLFLFKTGPFAWNGLLAFWVPGGLFFVWFLILGYYLIKARKIEN